MKGTCKVWNAKIVAEYKPSTNANTNPNHNTNLIPDPNPKNWVKVCNRSVVITANVTTYK